MNKFHYEGYDDENLSIFNIPYIIYYIQNNYIKFLLLLFEFFIIVVVDHISHFNAMIFSVQSPIIGLPMFPTNTNHIPNHIPNKQIKKGKLTKNKK